MVVFFFKQKTAYEMRISDWSSDVCSSDLLSLEVGAVPVVDPVGDAAIDHPEPEHAADGDGQGGAVGRCPGEAHGVGHGGALTAHDDVLDPVAQAADVDRKSPGQRTSMSFRVELGSRLTFNKKKKTT